MKMTNEYRWRRTVEWLRLVFPPLCPIRIRRCPLQECGDCEYDGTMFKIRVHARHPFRLQLDTLFHEWAHALSWFGPPGTDDHDGEWGLAYARIYSAFVKWNYGRGEK